MSCSDLLIDGNRKTGAAIKLFNLPRRKTCPGATPLCMRYCYAKAFNRFTSVLPAHEQRYQAAQKDDFVEDMISRIKKLRTKIVRIHTSGDFFSAKYVRRWISICKATPDTIYYGYTRSWRLARLLPALNDLRALPNVVLWWSTDKSGGQPPEGRVAYMAVDDTDVPAFSTDLIFRVKRDTVKTRIGRVLVCPKENGDVHDNLTCSLCKICFKDAIIS